MSQTNNTPSLQTSIQHLTLDNCLYNASGARCTSATELLDLAESTSGAFIAKSCTIVSRKGNPKPRYFENHLGSINSMGLPNLGYQFYLNFAKKQATNYVKPFLLSVAGLTLDNNLTMLKAIRQVDAVAAVELNLSCPNVIGKPQTGYDFDRTKYVLDCIFAFYDKPLGVKLPPYFDIVHFEIMADILNQYPLQFVTCVNSIGNGLLIDVDAESIVIKPKGGFGGIGGDYIKPTALANVHKFYQLLRNDIAIIGCGGVKSGQDAFEHILCGASAVQIGTQLMRVGTNCFRQIAIELQDIMQKKGYSCLDDFRGKLKHL